MITHTADQTCNAAPVPAGIASASRRLYDAECALHAAHQTHVDQWICAAADRLHVAVVDYERAIDAPTS